MPVTLLDSAEEFLIQTRDFRALHPYQLNLIGSVASSIAFNGRTYEKYFWWVIRDQTGEVVGLAMRTAPHGMVLSPMSKESATELAVQVVLHDDGLPEVAGPLQELDFFLNAYLATGSIGSKRDVAISGEELLYVLGELVPPRISGKARPACEEDFDLIKEWMLAFTNETGSFVPDPGETIRDGLARNSYSFWIDGTQCVSLAGHASIVEVPNGLVGRIGPVYTPPEHRGNGYAAAVTATVSQKLLDLGAQVMLFTDATNPTSNGVYKRIGFELLDENQRRRFLDA
ncbi:MAG: GNAT family N-acetyltransferase [Actinobacteria bacterium]|nr:GNAT family N-acetyltransferase [Actinomycetota bacterium]